MKKVKNFFATVLIMAYAIVAITVTILMLSYNEYKNPVVGGYTFLTMNDDGLEPEYNEGDLILVKKTNPKKIEVGDKIFLYRIYSTEKFEIKYAEVKGKSESPWTDEVTFSLEGDILINSDDVIGSTDEIKVIPNLGTVLSVLTSRYGYLFLVVMVAIIAFLYQVYELVMEIKYGDREEKQKVAVNEPNQAQTTQEGTVEQKVTTNAATTKVSETKNKE